MLHSSTYPPLKHQLARAPLVHIYVCYSSVSTTGVVVSRCAQIDVHQCDGALQLSAFLSRVLRLSRANIKKNRPRDMRRHMQTHTHAHTHTHTHTLSHHVSFSLLPRRVAQCVNSQLQHRALFLCCIHWCVLVIFFPNTALFCLCVFYQRCTVVVLSFSPLSPPLSSFASLQGWCDLRLCLKTEDRAVICQLLMRGCNSRRPHSTGRQKGRQRAAAPEGWVDGGKETVGR